MLKKLLIAVGVLAILGVVGFVFVLNKVDNEIKAREPEFRQYITMTVEEQNAYVERNIKAFLPSVSGESETQQKAFSKIMNNPELHEATIQLGRAVVAGFIMSYEPILKDLPADIKAQLTAEASELQTRSDTFTNLFEKYNQ